MALLVVLHRVKDYDVWRKEYDKARSHQASSGVTEESVYRKKDDPNNVLVLHRFATMAEAQAFMANPELQSIMERAGIAAPPRVEFYEEI
jgi:quinol monooxygenase YgiN